MVIHINFTWLKFIYRYNNNDFRSSLLTFLQFELCSCPRKKASYFLEKVITNVLETNMVRECSRMKTLLCGKVFLNVPSLSICSSLHKLSFFKTGKFLGEPKFALFLMFLRCSLLYVYGFLYVYKAHTTFFYI